MKKAQKIQYAIFFMHILP